MRGFFCSAQNAINNALHNAWTINPSSARSPLKLFNPDLCSGSCLLCQAAMPTPQTTQLLFNSRPIPPLTSSKAFFVCRIIIDA